MKQGKCLTCRVRWVWTDYEVERDRARCPTCRGLLHRTAISSPYPVRATEAYAVRASSSEVAS